MSDKLLLFVTIDLGSAELSPFEDYETRVLALLPEHQGELLARWRLSDGMTEHQLVAFADRSGYDSYMADERREAVRYLWDISGASIKVEAVRGI